MMSSPGQQGRHFPDRPDREYSIVGLPARWYINRRWGRHLHRGRILQTDAGVGRAEPRSERSIPAHSKCVLGATKRRGAGGLWCLSKRMEAHECRPAYKSILPWNVHTNGYLRAAPHWYMLHGKRHTTAWLLIWTLKRPKDRLWKAGPREDWPLKGARWIPAPAWWNSNQTRAASSYTHHDDLEFELEREDVGHRGGQGLF